MTNLGLKGCRPGFDDVLLGLLYQKDILHSVTAIGALAVFTEHPCNPAVASAGTKLAERRSV